MSRPFAVDLNAEIVDFPDTILTPIQPGFFDRMLNLVSIRWGRFIPRPIPPDVVPDRFLTLMLPFEYNVDIDQSNISPKVLIFVHVSNAAKGPTDRDFYVWKTGRTPFIFSSQPGIIFRGELGPGGIITYLRVYMPRPGYIIPNYSTPSLATIKRRLVIKNLNLRPAPLEGVIEPPTKRPRY